MSSWKPWQIYLVLAFSAVLGSVIQWIWLADVVALVYMRRHPRLRRFFWPYVAMLVCAVCLFVALDFFAYGRSGVR